MPLLTIKPADRCRYDAVALGEVMLRLDPGEGRIRTARSFRVWEGGGEYNVARGLRRCFGLRTAILSSFVDNEVGRLAEDLILQGGVDVSMLRWVSHDGIGRSVRNGLNFTERGFGMRGALGVSDRAHSAASQIMPSDFDWDHLFGTFGARWFHTGGIFAALGAGTADTVTTAVKAARRHGTIVSYDLNYRPSLWQDRGGADAAMKLNATILPLVDVLMGVDGDQEAMGRFAADFPNLRLIATTRRKVTSATLNDWSAFCLTDGTLHESNRYPSLEILDRVGGGDAFASGLIYGILEGADPRQALNLGAAHGALAMTTPGDNSMATLSEVRKLAEGGSPGTER
jgi:2-dehydro-3-deoxygluconokinase